MSMFPSPDSAPAVFVSFMAQNPGVPVTVWPIDGSADDMPRLNLIWQQASLTGNKVILAPGPSGQHYQCKSQQNSTYGSLYSNLQIEGTPDTVVDMLITGSASIFSQFFVAVAVQAGDYYGIAVHVARGSTTVQVTTGTGASPTPPSGPPNVGDWLQLWEPSHLYGSSYQVKAVSGSSPTWTVTVDRPINYDFAASVGSGASTLCQVVTGSPPDNIHIDGKGMLIQHGGTGNIGGALEWDGVINSRVENLRYDGKGTSPSGFCFDTWSYNCRAEDITITGCATTGAGLWIIGDSHRTRNCVARNCVHGGFLAGDAVEQEHVGLQAFGNGGVGITVSSDGGSGFYPSDGVKFIGGESYGNGNAGITVNNGAARVVFFGMLSTENGGSGASIAGSYGSPSLPQNVRFIGCSFTYNALDGIDIASGCKGTQLTSCDVSENAYCGVNAYEGVKAEGLYSSGGNGTGVYYANGGAGHFLSQVEVIVDQAYHAAIIALGASAVHLSDSHITLGGALCAVLATSSTKSDGSVERLHVTINANSEVVQLNVSGDLFSFAELTVDGSNVGGSYFFDTGSGTACRLRGRLAIDACSIPYVNTAGALWSRSLDSVAATFYTVPALGGTWAVSWPDTSNADRPALQLVAPNSGVPQIIPPVVKTLGTGFSATFAAADAGAKYAFEVL